MLRGWSPSGLGAPAFCQRKGTERFVWLWPQASATSTTLPHLPKARFCPPHLPLSSFTAPKGTGWPRPGLAGSS